MAKEIINQPPKFNIGDEVWILNGLTIYHRVNCGYCLPGNGKIQLIDKLALPPKTTTFNCPACYGHKTRQVQNPSPSFTLVLIAGVDTFKGRENTYSVIKEGRKEHAWAKESGLFNSLSEAQKVVYSLPLKKVTGLCTYYY